MGMGTDRQTDRDVELIKGHRDRRTDRRTGIWGWMGTGTDRRTQGWMGRGTDGQTDAGTWGCGEDGQTDTAGTGEYGDSQTS